MGSSPVSRALLNVSAVAFLGLYLTLSYFNRPVSDDLLFLSNMRELGWFQSLIQWPLNMRWGSYLLFNTFFFGVGDLLQAHSRLFLFQVCVLLLSITAFMLALKTLGVKGRGSLPVMAVLLVASLFFVTLQYGEVWFWAMGACVYIIPMISTIMLFGLVLYQGNIRVRYLWIIIFSVLAFGGLETWALISFCAFLLLAVVRKWHSGVSGIGHELELVLVMGAVMGIVTIMTSRIGDRMAIDRQGVEYFQSVHGYSRYRLMDVLKTLLHPRFPLSFLILLILPIQIRARPFALSKKQYMLAALSALVFVAIVTIAPLVMVYDGVGEARAWSPISTVLWITLAGACLSTGRFSILMSERLQIAGTALVLVGIIVYGYRVMPHAHAHALAYDARAMEFRQACEAGEAVHMTGPLPDPGVLISGDLEKDPNGIYNESLRKLLGLECQIGQTHY